MVTSPFLAHATPGTGNPSQATSHYWVMRHKLLTCLVLAGCAHARPPGEEAFLAGRYAEARAQAEASLRSNPYSSRSTLLVLRAQLRMGQRAAAAATYSRWAAQRGADAEFLHVMARETLRAELLANQPASLPAAVAIASAHPTPELRPHIVALLDHADVRVQVAAWSALLPDALALDRIDAFLARGDTTIVATVADHLHKLGRSANPRLLELVGHPAAEVRSAAVSSLAAIDVQTFRERLLHIAQHDTDAEVRSAALQALANARDTSLAEFALNEEALPSRLAGVRMLRQRGDAVQLRKLLSPQSGDRPAMRVALAAITGLHHLGEQDDLSAIDRALSHEIPAIRVAAIYAIGEWEAGWVDDRLRLRVGDADHGVQLAAAHALSHRATGRELAIRAFEQLAQATDIEVRIEAIAELVRLRSPDALARAQALAQNAPSAVRIRALRELYYQRDWNAAWAAALAAEEAGVRIAAADLLLRMTE